MGDSKYFTTTKKGEIHELKRDLDSPHEKVKKEAVKKVIADMTVGKDVSPLFPDVVKCIKTPNLELKKLVYLYVMNYAKTQPQTAILSVNAFVRDALHPNPLVRALAVRTMGCIRVDKITEYLCQPLRECLKDKDPYVRKTAAVCVAKMWDISAELVETQGFLDMLRDLLSDSNPMVVANAVAALSEIDESSKEEVFVINEENLAKLLAALNECTEWGQVFILHALAKYNPSDSSQAASIVERIAPRLAHSNSAVVLNTIRVLMRLLDFMEEEQVGPLCRKMTPPLVTLLQKQPEIQYVALRNINLVIQKRPQILQSEMKVFFCKYNDPIYVKMEKLEIMIMLVSERTIEQVLMELKEYATEVDVEFVRKAVRAIGRCAIKLDRAAERCIKVLLELIQTQVNYVVQEAIIVIKDIFRKYPNRYESIIATLCENLDTLDEPEAKAAMIWIIGEYADRIENADELLETFLDNFQDENSTVQLQLLTATVKLFLKKPSTTQKLVQDALELATKESGNPDLRDRGFVYWRLLCADAAAARKVVLGEKPLITDDSSQLEMGLLDDLIMHMSTLASVYHQPPEAFVPSYEKKTISEAPQKRKSDRKGKKISREETSGSSEGGDLLIDIGSTTPSPSPSDKKSFVEPFDFLTGQEPTTMMQNVSISGAPMQLLLSAEAGKGFEVRGRFEASSPGSVFLRVQLANRSQSPMSGFMIQFDKNTFRLQPTSTELPIKQLAPGQVETVEVGLNFNGKALVGAPSSDVAIAFKNNVEVFFCTAKCYLWVFFSPQGALEKKVYLDTWKRIPDQNEQVRNATIGTNDVDQIITELGRHNVFLIAQRVNNTNDNVLYLSTKVVPPNSRGDVVLVELIPQNDSTCRICTRTNTLAMIPLFEEAILSILSN
eukprot:CAMPEP_0174262238 /NCGR_PEP_ID=MMETSP0439-20130205/12860_1 /TAXON_ID=0 /ORGANISM="Stereomyxa ramosa, Strain Chinc5" /LENGTH=893 /DNA_ID=CAMNT_0015346919 /DNA_START=35 /DNA_END=2713 /DNA_ORIENTATION=-